MSDLRYWRWQALRNAPLAIAIFTLMLAAGLTAIRMMPQRQTAQSRVVLQTPLALHDTPRAARSAQDVQHLQVVMHRLAAPEGRAAISGTSDALLRADLETKITSGRDKPTNLTIQAHGATGEAATRRAKAATDFAISVSNALQRDRVEASLGNLKSLVEKQTAALAMAKTHLATLGNPEGPARLLALEQEATQIKAQLAGQRTVVQPQNPALVALQKELAKARVIYSDLHPKVRLLMERIDSLPNRAMVTPKDTRHLDARLATVQRRIAEMTAAMTEHQAALTAVSDAQNRLAQSKDALIDARLKGERSVARLKLVEDATPLTALAHS